METVYFNGKFAAQATTGVQRVGHCMLAALDRRLAADVQATGRRWVLLCPPGSRPPILRHIEVRIVGSVRAGLQLWEQWFLPRAARGGLLVNLAGTAPAFAGRQICTLHDAAIFDRPEAYSWMFLAWYRWLFRRLARTAVSIVTVSEFSKERLRVRLGCKNERIHVNPLGGDHLVDITASVSALQSKGLAGVRFVLAVGSDNPSKNIAMVIEGLANLVEVPRLVVVGGSSSAVFARRPPGETSTANVIRIGHVDDAELKALYRAAQCLVFASLYEGFGLPPLEAMSCDCPVLVSGAASLPEVCGDAALYADPDSSTDIASKVNKLMTDLALREDMILRGRDRLPMFTWEAAATRLRAHVEDESSCSELRRL